MDAHSLFSLSYLGARQKFMQSATASEARLSRYKLNDFKGAEGEELFMDVARIGADNPEKVFFITSGTHGAEGYCGSAIQMGLLASGLFSNVPDNLAIVLVHAVNPHGFSHKRRVNETNVDLNRNFINFEQPARENPAYSNLHDYLVPIKWSGPEKEQADRALNQYIGKHGMADYQSVVCYGQYSHPDGLFYGGASQAWSNKTLRSVIKNHSLDAREVVQIDIHTGLGPFGFGEVLCTSPHNSPGARNIRKWLGDRAVTLVGSEDSSTTDVDGYINKAFYDEVATDLIVSAGLEFGTVPLKEMIETLRADNWLYLHGDVHSPLGKEIKQQMKRTFYPDSREWEQTVWDQGFDIVTKVLNGFLRDT